MTIDSTYISVDRLKVFARHGVFAQETTVGNEFEVSVRLRVNVPQAMADDELDGTVSYADVVDIIKREMAIPSRLLEHVASRIARAIDQTFPAVKGGTLTVAKLHPPIAAQMAGASFTIEWTA